MQNSIITVKDFRFSLQSKEETTIEIKKEHDDFLLNNRIEIQLFSMGPVILYMARGDRFKDNGLFVVGREGSSHSSNVEQLIDDCHRFINYRTWEQKHGKP